MVRIFAVWCTSICIPFQNLNLSVSVSSFLAAMMFVIIGTQYILEFHFLYDPCNCELRSSISIVIVPSFENRYVMFLSRIIKTVVDSASFHLLGWDAPLSISGRLLCEKECRCRKQFKLLLDLTLDLLNDDWDWIDVDNYASTSAIYMSWRNIFETVFTLILFEGTSRSNAQTLSWYFRLCFERSLIDVNFCPSSGNNSFISYFFLTHFIIRNIKIERSTDRPCACAMTSVEIPSNHWSITVISAPISKKKSFDNF